MESMPLVSVLIGAYNAEQWLSDALGSALGQTHPNVEVVVVDDGSTDGTLALAQSYAAAHPDRVVVATQQNQGACAARNRALELARGPLVKYLDADDALAPDALAVQVAHIEAAGGATPFGDLMRTDASLRPCPGADPARPPAGMHSTDTAERVAALLVYNINTPLPLHRREHLVGVGGFRVGLRRGQEYDLHLRLALAGVRFVHAPHVTSYVRNHASPDRITNTSPLLSDPGAYLTVQVERRELLEAHLGRPLPEPVRNALAASAWTHTRRLVQAGQAGAAEEYAAEALRLDPSVRRTGRAFGRLARVLGPVRSEQVLVRLRTLVGRGVSSTSAA